MDTAYSSVEQTNVIYAVSLSLAGQRRRFLLRKPRVEFARLWIECTVHECTHALLGVLLHKILCCFYRVLRAICCQPSMADLSASCKCSRLPSDLVNGQELTMCDIVWISPQSQNSLLVKPHFLWHALQWPWPVQKRFSSHH